MRSKRAVLKNLTLSVRFDVLEQIPHRLWVELTKYIADYKCEICASTIFLEAHHIDVNSENNCLSNGLCLCRECHGKLHIVLNHNKRISAFTPEFEVRLWV